MPIQDFGEITQHLLLATISHQVRKNGYLQVVPKGQVPGQKAIPDSFSSIEDLVKSHLQRGKRKLHEIVALAQKQFTNKSMDDIKMEINNMIQDGHITNDMDNNLTLI